MTTISKIEWTERTWNPTVGCIKVSPGCKHCYTEGMAARLQAMRTPGYERGFELTMLPQRLQDPLKRKTPITRCGAEFYTPFFIRNKKGHGDYWLIHMSQHYRACDVMTEVHWDNQNYFIHYGGSGLNMFNMVGYDPSHDANFKGQSDFGFEFDDVARKASVSSLMEQIPRLIYADDVGMSFGELFAKTCNCSPASTAIYRDTTGHLLDHKIVEVIGADGAKRRSGLQIKLSDQIVPARQKNLFIL